MNLEFTYHLGIDFTFKSEPGRYIHFLSFKLKDIIVNENFRVIVHLKNYSKTEFPGGTISLRVEHDETPDIHKPWISSVSAEGFEIPKIPPNEKIELSCPFTFKSPYAGTNYLSLLLITAKDSKKIFLTPLNVNEPPRSRAVSPIDLKEYRVPFTVVNKEEVYQYSGVWLAIIAIILSIIAILISILIK